MAVDFAGRMRSLMQEQGLGVRALARKVPCDPGLVSRLANGKDRPSQQMAVRLDDVLDAKGELADLARATRIPAAPDTGTGPELIELARRAEASDLGTGTLELLQASADQLCRDYPTHDPAALSARAREYLRYAVRLASGRVTLAEHKELLVISGWLSGLLACALRDAGDEAAAGTARRMTRQFGQHAGHGELIAWSFEIAAWFALMDGQYARVTELSEAGLQHTGISSAAVQLALQAARGCARMGDRGALTALGTGQKILGKLPEPEHPEHHFAFDHGKYEFYTGTILTWLGTDDTAAEEHASWVISRCHTDDRGRWPMRLAISELDIALIAARRGDLDRAVQLAASALSHQRRSAQLLPRAAELGRDLAARYPGERLTAAYADRLATQRGNITRSLTP